MPTAAQYGMATPVGTEFISDGDNVITQNAHATASALTRLESGDFTPQPIPMDADLNNIADGFYYARGAAQSGSVLNKPAGTGTTPFEFLQRTSSEGAFQYKVQEFSGYSGSTMGYHKRNTSDALGTTFISWLRLDNQEVGAAGTAGAANELRVQEFHDAMGTVNTNGRGAVALRFDHGLANFDAKIRPLLEARNIPYSLALSARNFNVGENAGVTAAMVDGWALAEVWNHGANQHQDQTSVSGLTDQIVTGKTELQALLPSKKIWGYAVPGTGGTGQGGFNGGSTVEEFYTTLAGDLILANHAVSSGSFPGTARRPLDGEVRQGMAHFTIEAQTVSRIKLEIDNAISNRTGNQLMMHPSLLDTSGYLTTAQLTEVLDYIKAKQDSGELVVLSPYEMMVASTAEIEDAVTDKGTMPAESDANTFEETGLWYTGGAGTVETQINLAVNLPSQFFVLAGSAPYSVSQIQMPSVASDQGIYTRSKTNSTAWSPWKKLLAQGEALATGTAPANTDFDTYLTPGMVYTGGAGTIETQTGLAEQVPSTVWIGGGGSVFNATQIQIPTSGSQVRFWVRARANSTSWTAWTDLAAGGSGGGGAPSGAAVNWTATPASHEMRVRAFKDAYPLTSTGNKGVVCFRFDHGLTNFKSTLLPLFQANGITPYIAMNSRNWADAENSGATQAEASAWNVEWGNHTADHRDRNDAQGIYDSIVNGRKELEAQLGRTIHGFTVPGLSEYNKFEGFSTGTLNTYSETLAGGLILANHAICSGSIGNQRRPLDGEIRQGGRHYTWESSDWTTIKSQIDAAVSTKTALTLMCHPSTMNLSGYWTPALAQQVIEYVKSLIDAGTLANVSYYQSHHATL